MSSTPINPIQNRRKCHPILELLCAFRGTSYENRSEVAAVERVVRRFLGGGVKKREVTALSMYGGQVAGLRGAGLGVEVSTVDGFQGRENDVVIVSTVRARGRLGE